MVARSPCLATRRTSTTTSRRRTRSFSEYNWVYTAPAPPPAPPVGICVKSSSNTCTPVATVADIYTSAEQNMFDHMMGNDPRPHYFHQSNMIGGSTTGLYYQVMTPLLAEYNQYFNEPIRQPTTAQIAAILAQQAAWAGNTTVSGYIQGNQVVVTSGAMTDVPITGITGVGSSRMIRARVGVAWMMLVGLVITGETLAPARAAGIAAYARFGERLSRVQLAGVCHGDRRRCAAGRA